MSRPDIQAPLIEWAQWYASEMKWPVFPVAVGKKIPLTPHGFHDATTDPKQIAAWWKRWPQANIGLPTGTQTDTMILDVDVKPWEGKHGDKSLVALESANEPLPKTVRMRTWSGGNQFFFASCPEVINRSGAFGQWLDARSQGGYTVLPPSKVSENGRSGMYVWEDDPNGPRAELPEWLIAVHRQIVQTNGYVSGLDQKPGDGIPNGQRNDTLYRMGRSMHFKGFSPETIGESLTIANARDCHPPLAQDELVVIIRQAVLQQDRDGYRHGERPHTTALGTDNLSLDQKLIGYPLTDAGNAERLIARYGDRFRWLTDTEEWLAWDGKRWAAGSEDVVRRYVLQTARDLQSATVDYADSWEREWEPRERVMKHAIGLESIRNVNGAMSSARYMTPIQAKRTDFDQNPDILNVSNGTLDLKTFTLSPHNPQDHISQVIPVAYDPDAQAPTWTQFLRDVFLGDDDVIRYVQRAIGYSMTGSIAEQCFFMEHGGGENGKSTFKDVLAALFGEYATKLDQEAILVSENGRGSRATPEMVVLIGKRFAYVDEMEEGRAIDEAKIKALTGSAKSTGRALYSGMREWPNTAKLWFDLNNLPRFKGVDDGIARRPRIIPFDWRVPAEKKVKDFAVQLLEELPGILAWAVEGCKAWRADGLAAPEAVSLATRAYVEENNHLPAFFAECCEITTGGEKVSAAGLKAAYQAWCLDREDALLDYQRKVVPYLKGVRKLTLTKSGSVRYWAPLRLLGTPRDASPQSPPYRVDIEKVCGEAPSGVPISPANDKTALEGQIDSGSKSVEIDPDGMFARWQARQKTQEDGQ